MIRTLDEAIKHCKEKVKEIRQANEEMPIDCKLSKELCECANDHEQLAEWLEQLQAIKLLYKEYERFGGGFHYQVGRVFDGDYVLDNKESEDK